MRDPVVIGVDRQSMTPLQLSDESAFLSHPWVERLMPRFLRDEVLARHAMRRLTADLKNLNELVIARERRAFLTSIDGRVKTQRSFFRKLFRLCRERSCATGVTPQVLQDFYLEIRDLCGVRFACPYYDEIEPAIHQIRSFLGELGYATQLAELSDKNFLDAGDQRGYRSYHFYVKIPTTTSIFGDGDLCLCEVQARSELQHVWAMKSHDLLYKPETGWQTTDPHVLEDMRQLSNSLRAADQSLLSIRDRSRPRSDRGR